MKQLSLSVVFCVVTGVVPATACTFFVKTSDGVTLAGNSEDSYEADTCAVIIPSSPGKYGRIYFGWTNVWLQGGVNEEGLAYDIMALWPKQFERPPAGRAHEPGRLALIRRIMETCATVEEALELMETHVNPIAGSGNWERKGVGSLFPKKTPDPFISPVVAHRRATSRCL